MQEKLEKLEKFFCYYNKRIQIELMKFVTALENLVCDHFFFQKIVLIPTFSLSKDFLHLFQNMVFLRQKRFIFLKSILPCTNVHRVIDCMLFNKFFYSFSKNLRFEITYSCDKKIRLTLGSL